MRITKEGLTTEQTQPTDVVRGLAIAAGSTAFLLALSQFGFSHWVKDLIYQQQEGKCADGCGQPIDEYHHIIPEKMLMRRGIKGKNIVENCVGLAFDCHKKKWDPACRHGEFFPGVSLDELDPSTYSGVLRENKSKKIKFHGGKRR